MTNQTDQTSRSTDDHPNCPHLLWSCYFPASWLNRASSYHLNTLLPGIVAVAVVASVVSKAEGFEPALLGKWPSHALGPADSVAVQDGIAYVALGDAGLQIFDVSDPAQFIRLGEWKGQGSARAVAVSADLAYVTDGDFRVIDVSDPTRPRLVGTSPIAGPAEGVAVSGRFAYVAARLIGLHVIDITDPANPQQVGYLSLDGSARRVALAGSLAYVAAGESGLHIVDVSDPTMPTQIRTHHTEGLCHSVAVAGNVAYLAGGRQSGLKVIDVTDPSDPRTLGEYHTQGDAIGVAVAGDRVYVAEQGEKDAEVVIFDINDPILPRKTGAIKIRGRAGSDQFDGQLGGIAAATGTVFAAVGMGTAVGLQVLDPTSHLWMSSYETQILYPMDVKVVGSHAYVTCGENGLKVVDVSDATNPHEVGYFQTEGYALGVGVSEETAFITQIYHVEHGGERSEIVLMDITSPSNPKLQGVYGTTGHVQALAISSQFAFAAVQDYGPGRGRLEVIDLSDVANPRHVSRFNAESFHCYAVAISGNHAYMTTLQRFHVLDVADPLNPRSLGWCEIEHGGYGVTISGKHAYVANHLGGLLVIEIGDPSNPRPVGQIEMRGVTSRVSVAGRFAYATASTGAPEGWGYLRVFDVSNPVNPKWHVSHNTGWMASPSGVSIVDDLIYVAAGVGGLQILDISALINQACSISFGPPTPSSHGGLRLPLTGPAELRVRIQRSVNLRDWEDWSIVSLGGGRDLIDYDDHTTTAQRFYRAVEAPTTIPDGMP